MSAFASLSTVARWSCKEVMHLVERLELVHCKLGFKISIWRSSGRRLPNNSMDEQRFDEIVRSLTKVSSSSLLMTMCLRNSFPTLAQQSATQAEPKKASNQTHALTCCSFSAIRFPLTTPFFLTSFALATRSLTILDTDAFAC